MMSPQLISKLRSETIGCQHVLHFNNAGAALQPNAVMDAVKNHLELECRVGGYEAANQVSDPIEKFYNLAANLIHCEPEEIAFMENATRAWDMVFYSIPLQPGDRILTSVSEYASNYLGLLHRARKTGANIVVIPNDRYGQLDIEALNNLIDEKVKLIAVTHVPTQGGLINPAAAIGKIAQANHIPYLLDATQSVGQMPIDVTALGCDFLCATGRKYLRGPRGTGFLYASKKYIETLDPPFIDLHAATWTAEDEFVIRSDARRFESWERNIAATLGLAAAIQYVLDLGITEIWERILYLADHLRQVLSSVPGIQLRDLGENTCGIITFTCGNHPPAQLQQFLATRKMNVSVSLEEYARLDLSSRNLQALTRASVHYYNTEEEIELFCRAVKDYTHKFMHN